MAKKSMGLTGNQLKILALICMTVDHVGMMLLHQYPILRCIGRLAMPVFAWMLAEGCRYTKNRFVHLLTVASLALLCQAVYWVVERSLYQCILVTFTLAIVLIYALDYAIRKRGVIATCLLAGVFGAVTYVCVFLPETVPGFHVEYGFFGVILPAAIYMGRTKEEKLFAAACCLTGIALNLGGIQWLSLASLPVLCLYGGKRGKARLKYLFYIYYPLHLVVIYALAYLLS